MGDNVDPIDPEEMLARELGREMDPRVERAEEEASSAEWKVVFSAGAVEGLLRPCVLPCVLLAADPDLDTRSSRSRSYPPLFSTITRSLPFVEPEDSCP